MSLHKDFGVTHGEIVEVMRKAGYFGFGKAQLSQAENGERTGVCIMPSGMKALSACWPEYAGKLPGAPAAKKNRDKNRKLGVRFTFRTTEDFARRMETLRHKMGFATRQEFFAYAMKEYVANAEADIRRKEQSEITCIKENENETHT